MCFGHEYHSSGQSGGPSPANPSVGGNTIYGPLSGFSRLRQRYGWSVTVAHQWTARRIDCLILDIDPGARLDLPCLGDRETVLTVEAGSGVLSRVQSGARDELRTLDALRMGPDASASVAALTSMRVMMTSMHVPSCPAEHRNLLEVRPRNDHDWKLYEYEALGQEVFAPEYEGALGLLRFMFPQDEIPVHVHPGSGRIIRPISGRGYTYMHPDRCPMDAGTIAAFDANVIHTNGPLKGETYELWALQLPWIPSGIDTENIAGHEQFVRYVSDVPVPSRYKTKAGLLERARTQQAQSGGIQADRPRS